MNLAIILDTNAYRILCHDKTETEIIKEISTIISKEKSKNIEAYASPLVMLELFAHLADPTDPAYQVCKTSIIALYKHCSTNNGNNIRIIADSESILCYELYKQEPSEHYSTTQKLCNLCKYVYNDFSESSLNKVRADFQEISKIVSVKENQFADDIFIYVVKALNPNATDWKPLADDRKQQKKILKIISSNDTLKLIAKAFVYKILFILQLKETEIENKTNMILSNYETPLRLYREILKRIVETGCDLTKKNRINWLWDIQIAFNIGPNHLVNGKKPVLITDDSDIVNAAKDAGCQDYVFLLHKYMDMIES